MPAAAVGTRTTNCHLNRAPETSDRHPRTHTHTQGQLRAPDDLPHAALPDRTQSQSKFQHTAFAQHTFRYVIRCSAVCDRRPRTCACGDVMISLISPDLRMYIIYGFSNNSINSSLVWRQLTSTATFSSPITPLKCATTVQQCRRSFSAARRHFGPCIALPRVKSSSFITFKKKFF